MLAALRTSGVELAPELAAEAERLIGGLGAEASQRLGVASGTGPEALAAEARGVLARWRRVSENPLTARSAVEACRVVIRSCEGVLADCTGSETGTARQPQSA